MQVNFTKKEIFDMKTNEKMLAKNISKEYNKREVFISLLIKICKDFKIKNIKEKIVRLLK